LATPKKAKKEPYLTGWCHSGWCEGIQEIPGRKGIPTPRCKGLYESQAAGRRVEMICGCSCHKRITEMYEIAGLPREWPTSQWSEEDMKLRRERGEVFDYDILNQCIEDSRRHKAVDLEEDAVEPVPTLQEREEVKSLDGVLPPHPHVEDPKRRDAGYRPKGQLLFDTKIAVDTWVLGAYPHIKVLNCSAIATLINEKMPPSTGAITNILRRWERVGFAHIGEGPLQFLRYTKAGVEHGFDALEENYKALVSSKETQLDAARKTALRQGTRT
jgi:hypothetical protein